VDFNLVRLYPKGLAQVVEALVLRFAPFKVLGSTPYEYKLSLGATPLVKSHRFNQFCIRKFPRVQCTILGFTLQRWVRRALP
jgi:hypothetical protein